ncbi:MAG: CBS domain-containing protein [Thermodesulfovibrionales bacterium]
MATVQRLLEMKTKGFWTVDPDTTAFEALKIMAEADVGALLVVRGHSLLGIFTERDYSRKVILRGRSSKETTVGELMTESVFCVTPGDTIEHCMDVMNSMHVRHLPVLEDGQVRGLVSIRDVVNMIIAARESTIRDLEQYISS